MDTTATRTEAGEIVYERHTPLQARLIVGSLLSFFAIFFGYYLFSGLTRYIRTATPGEWLGAIPGLLLVLILLLLFAVPAWAVFFARTKVIIDPLRGFLVDELDLLLYRWSKKYPFDQVSEVHLVKRIVRVHRRGSASYAVEILLKSGKRITVAFENEIEDARKLAAQAGDNFRCTVTMR